MVEQPAPYDYDAMNEDYLREITERNHMLLELIKRILALPDPAIMGAEEKVKWIGFLSGLNREGRS